MGLTITLTYDTLNRPSTKVAPGEATVTFTYYLNGHVTNVSDTSAAITITPVSASYTANSTYDPLNHSISLTWIPAATQTTPTASSVTFTH